MSRCHWITALNINFIAIYALQTRALSAEKQNPLAWLKILQAVEKLWSLAMTGDIIT